MVWIMEFECDYQRGETTSLWSPKLQWSEKNEESEELFALGN